MSKTGMFFPRSMEKTLTPSSPIAQVLLVLFFAGIVIGSAFLLRFYAISRLTLWTRSPYVTGIAILPEDGFKMDHRMNDILALNEVKGRMDVSRKYLVYFIPQNYIMQGMIADTGGDWKLFNQHHSIAMIMDWIFNPFGHLRKGHHAMHEGMHAQHQQSPGQEGGVVRRLIFLSVEDGGLSSPSDLFAINALRVPQFMVDVDVHNMLLLEVKDLAHGSGWGTVPTPVF